MLFSTDLLLASAACLALRREYIHPYGLPGGQMESETKKQFIEMQFLNQGLNYLDPAD